MKTCLTYFFGILLFCIEGNSAFAIEPPEVLAGDPFAETASSTGISLTGDPFAENSEKPSEVEAEALEQNRNSFFQKGWLESRNQFWLRNGRAFSTRQRLWLEGGSSLAFDTVAEVATARFFVSGSADFDLAAADLSTDHDQFSAILHEAYFTVEGRSADLVIGQKMVRWGTGDGVNPLDLINPQDHRDPFASGRGDNRLAVPLIQGIVSLPVPDYVQELTLEAVVVPLAKVTSLNAAGSAWEPLALQKMRDEEQTGTICVANQEKPAQWFEEGKYGLHLTTTVGGWDLGLTGYSGIKNIPVFTAKPESNNRLVITPVHPRITAFGASFAKGVRRSTLRGELAVKPRYPMQKKDVFIPGYSRRTLVESVVGFDRTFGLNRYLNLQYFAEYMPENDGIAGRRYSHGLTFECSDLFFNDDLKLGVSGVVGFSGQGWAAQPYVEYRVGDSWLLTASFFLFQGDEDEKYGQFAERDFASLRLRYSF